MKRIITKGQSIINVTRKQETMEIEGKLSDPINKWKTINKYLHSNKNAKLN